VISVTQIHTGKTDNVISETALYQRDGYVSFGQRTCSHGDPPGWSDRRRQSASYDVSADAWNLKKGYPATREQPPKKAGLPQRRVGRFGGRGSRHRRHGARWGFRRCSALLLDKRAGAYLFNRQGIWRGLHHAAYNFDDGNGRAVGASFFAVSSSGPKPLESQVIWV